MHRKDPCPVRATEGWVQMYKLGTRKWRPNNKKALALQSKTGDFALTTIPLLRPGRGEVLVKVQAAALNPIDWKMQGYGWFIQEYPSVIGSDIAGDIVGIGEGVTDLVICDRVLFAGAFANTKGQGTAGFQQYTRTDIYSLSKIPPALTLVEASTIPAAISTAYVGLYSPEPLGAGYEAPSVKDAQNKYNGVPIAILGGSSSVGQLVIQLAHLSGFNPIITTSSLKHAEFLKSLGATHVLDRLLTHSETISAVKDIIGDTPLKLIYAAISNDETQKLGLDLVAPGGHLIITLYPTIETQDGKKVIHVHALKSLPQNIAILREMHIKLTEWLKEGLIKPNRVEILDNGLSGVVDGLERLENNKVSGVKLVALPQVNA
ncbi:GroES-like protein [Coprinopsis marcescibilis]|uniref:GroES-like protein n=1 Tax=Coprinopsis marcescibilis TaxID=230819 RepID=A0A5C3KNF2_COPMA|nr:GroES-like protein [Coprinopsis marcescibilis]